MSTIGGILADAQITNGGPVVLVQPENEYTYATPNLESDYMAYVEQQLRNAGVTVPLMSNDAYPAGNFVPGSGTGAVDIYGYDGYPLGFVRLHSHPSKKTRSNNIKGLFKPDELGIQLYPHELRLSSFAAKPQHTQLNRRISRGII